MIIINNVFNIIIITTNTTTFNKILPNLWYCIL